MQAKVKKDYRYPAVTAFSGLEYVKFEFRAVPAFAEDEAKRHPALEIQELVPEAVVEVLEEKADEEAAPKKRKAEK